MEASGFRHSGSVVEEEEVAAVAAALPVGSSSL